MSNLFITKLPLMRADRFRPDFNMQFRPVIRPRFYVLRPDERFVPLIPADELPGWIYISQIYAGNFEGSELVCNAPIPRLGEYEALCLFCESALRDVVDRKSWHNQHGETLDMFEEALIDRAYTPYVYPSSFYRAAYGSHRICEPELAERLVEYNNDYTDNRNNTSSTPSSLNAQAPEFKPGGKSHQFFRCFLCIYFYSDDVL